MSRREIDANNRAKAQQRETQIQRIIGELALIDADWTGKPVPMDVEAKRARLEDELRELENLRSQAAAILEAPTIEQKVEYLNDAVLSMYPLITGLQRSMSDWQASTTQATNARNTVIDRWLVILAALLALAYGAIGTLFYVYR